MHYQDLENCRDILRERRNITQTSFIQACKLFWEKMLAMQVNVFVCFYQNNYLVFMAELFWWFEVVKPPFVQPQVLETEGRLILQWNVFPRIISQCCLRLYTDTFVMSFIAPAPSLKNLPSVPISKVTKRSFMERPPSPDRPRYIKSLFY